MAGLLTPALADRLAGIALGHVAREYPHKLDHVLDGAEDARTPSQLHPVFHGSFDWHSNVHSHWLLARTLRRFPETPHAAAIRAHLDQAIVPHKVAGEVAYFSRASASGSSRPYGWAWLLQLSVEFDRHDAPWGAALRPLAELLAARFHAFLPKQIYPIRVGTHFNTSFALTLARDYPGLRDLCDSRARDYFLADQGCSAWGEPGGDEFLSPSLIEAELMRRVLGDGFPAWFARFMPTVPESLLTPAVVSDPTDGKIAHLYGLNLARAWCWRGIALGGVDVDGIADLHIAASMPHLTSDYAGEHWLATYAMLALDGL